MIIVLNLYRCNNYLLIIYIKINIKMMNMDWRKVNFALYCFAFLFYGSIITAMGPIIPFFSA